MNQKSLPFVKSFNLSQGADGKQCRAYNSSRTVDKQAAQVPVSALGNAHQCRSIAAGELPRYNPPLRRKTTAGGSLF
jgi:hypothetical protein